MENIYGKLNVFGELKYAPETLTDGNSVIINPTEEDFRKHGYKIVIIDEKPEGCEGLNTEEYYFEDSYTIYVRTRLSEEEPEI